MGSNQSTSIDTTIHCNHKENGNMENFRSEKKQVKGNKYICITYCYRESFKDLKMKTKVDGTANVNYK